MLEMARWGADDLIEYLLATHRDRCPSVMGRLKQSPADASAVDGVAALWSVVLEAMCSNDALATPVEALRHVLAARLGDACVRQVTTDYCLTRLLRADASGDEPPGYFARADPLLARLISCRPVQVLLAAQRIVWDLAAGTGSEHVGTRLPPDLVREVAALATFREPVMGALRDLTAGSDRRAHSTAASILHATDTGWRPAPRTTLVGAGLAGARWPRVDLSDVSLSGADLCDAVLDGARLDGAAAGQTRFRGASFRAASLRGLRAIEADFSGADLCGACADEGHFDDADLSGADLSAGSFRAAWFTRANLSDARLIAADFRKARFHDAALAGTSLAGADLREASFTGVDLTGVELAGARLAGAKLIGCDLQDVRLTGASLGSADLSRSDLTGSALPGADLRQTVLRMAGLANVHWEGADLRGADLTGASFHLGSTRGGLVGSTTPCEGSRTGFYTDDYEERYYRPPDEVRKANLCGADLRGATVADSDFYLVDLRGARYTVDQARHFHRCGAIM